LRIHVTDTRAVEAVVVDEREQLDGSGDRRLRQLAQQSEDLPALVQMAECEFTHHPRVAQHESAAKERREAGVPRLQVLDPDRGINQDQ
jgi:hypothetical protein